MIINIKVGLGKKTHRLDVQSLTSYGYAICGIGGILTITKQSVSCQSCLKIINRNKDDNNN